MVQLLLTILAIGAVWRLTQMLQNEDGPFGIFARLQAWAARKPERVGGINRGFYCFWCLSVWVALPFALLLSFNKFFIIYWLALSAGAILIETMPDPDEQ